VYAPPSPDVPWKAILKEIRSRNVVLEEVETLARLEERVTALEKRLA